MRHTGLTTVEVLTAVVALVVITAVAIPMWHTRQLRERREDAMEALEAVQKAQDDYFAEHSRYAAPETLHGAPPAGLGLARKSSRGFYDIEIGRSEDGLAYRAEARQVRSTEGEVDARCVQLALDQHGRRTASNAQGVDTSEDCWNRL
jgi:Tfp pilus assembly protein PilE